MDPGSTQRAIQRLAKEVQRLQENELALYQREREQASIELKRCGTGNPEAYEWRKDQFDRYEELVSRTLNTIREYDRTRVLLNAGVRLPHELAVHAARFCISEAEEAKQRERAFHSFWGMQHHAGVDKSM